MVTLKESLQYSIMQIEENSQRPDYLLGISSGFASLDKITQGWQKGDMIVIAGRPAMGKTAFVLSIVRNITVNDKIPVLFFTQEMSSIQLTNRLIISETELSGYKIRTGKLEDYEWNKLETKIQILKDAPLFIEDKIDLSIDDIENQSTKYKTENNIQLIIIDSLQTINGYFRNDNTTRDQEIGEISRRIKVLARKLNIPIIVLSQTNRSSVARGGDNRPQMNDLRESGSIEYDADIICFIHRPQYYGILQDAEGNSTEGLGQVIIAKNRNGATCDVNLHFRAEFARFEEWDSMGLTTGLAPLDDSGNMVQTFGSSMNNDAPGTGFDPFSSPNPFGGGGAPPAGDMGGVPEEAPF